MILPSPILFLGEAPNAATARRSDLWLLPDDSGKQHTANRLLKYLGWSRAEYLLHTERDNLMHCPTWAPGKAWLPSYAAKRLARDRILEHPKCSAVVCLGARVARSFSWVNGARRPGVRRSLWPPITWGIVKIPAPCLDADSPWNLHLELPACWVPHPSGRNRWWNVATNREAGEAFMRRILELIR